MVFNPKEEEQSLLDRLKNNPFADRAVQTGQSQPGVQSQAALNTLSGQSGNPFEMPQWQPSPEPGSVGGTTPGQDFADLLRTSIGITSSDPQAPLPMYNQAGIDELETGSLQGQVQEQRGTLAFLDPEADVPERDESPGTLSKVFDILLRPNYASAGAAMHLEREGGVEGIGRAMLDGLRGETKYTYSDVLDEAGVENKYVKGVGGFVLDVALDPTTYLGAGVVRAAGKGAVEAAGARAAVDVYTNPASRAAARDAAENQLQRQLAENLAPQAGKKGKKLDLSSPQKQEEFLDTVTERILKQNADQALQTAKRAVDNAGKVEFKFAGRKFGESAALYSGVSRAFKPLRELDPVQRLNTMFRPKAELGEMHGLSRLHQGMSIGKYEDHVSTFRHMMREFTPDQRVELSHAIEQGRHLADPQMAKAAEHIKSMFKNMWDDEVAAGIHRAGSTARDNYVYHMYKVDPKKATAFKKTQGLKGESGYAKERVLATLEDAKIQGMKPVEDILEIVQTRAAKHFQDMTHYSMMEDAMTNLGAQVGSRDAVKLRETLEELGTSLERFTWTKNDGTKMQALFPKEIADTLTAMNKVYVDDTAAKGFVRMFDTTLRNTKFWLTVANPGHHVRNFVGNAYMAYQDGVRNPNRYKQAFAGVRGNTDRAVGGPLSQRAKNTKVKIGNSFVDTDELFQLYKATGTKSGFFDVELGREFGGKFSQTIRHLSTQREDTARFGHFIDALAKTQKGKNFNKLNTQQKIQAALPASQRVRKFQLDYGDLTSFEADKMRRILMFYTFARKNTALQVEMLFTRPGKIANVAKANTAVEQVLGVDNPVLEQDDFWERVPEWVQVMNAPQIGGDGNFVQQLLGTVDPVYGNMLLPTSDLNRIQAPQDALKTFLGEMRPELRAPVELGTGAQVYSGAPVPGGGQYLSQQVPITNLLYKLANDESTNTTWGQDLFNYLTGLSTQTVTPERQRGELRRQQQPVQEQIRDRRAENLEEFLEQIRGNRPERALYG